MNKELMNTIKNIVRKFGITVHRAYEDKKWKLRKKRVLRPSIKAILQKYDRKLTGVEIGVLRGEHAKTMLTKLDIEKMYLIDPYSEYKKYSRFHRKMDTNKRIAHKQLAQFEDKTVWLEKLSENAVEDIEEQVDFVYIDGNHQFQYVMKDITLYYPLVKEDGILAGHDYCLNDVTKAVQQFISETNHKLYVGRTRDRKVDWWIHKDQKREEKDDKKTPKKLQKEIEKLKGKVENIRPSRSERIRKLKRDSRVIDNLERGCRNCKYLDFHTYDEKETVLFCRKGWKTNLYNLRYCNRWKEEENDE